METKNIAGTASSCVPVRSPDLLLRQVGDGYAYAVNCSFPNSFRLLKQKQYEILKSVNGTDDVNTIADKSGMETGALGQFFDMLRKTEIVRFDNRFSVPQKPVTPNSLNFWVHTTNACNLGCSYCYISTLNTSGGMEKKVRQQLLHKMIDAAETDGIRHIRLRLAGGEPLGQFSVWKEFIFKAKQALAPLGCRLDAGFVTNLTMLNDDMIAFAKEYHIGFGVSLDGVEKLHDATRSFHSGCGSFGIVDANLKKLLANDIPVSINTVVTNLNLAGLPELTAYLIKLDVPFRYSIVKGGSIHAELLEEYLSKSLELMKNEIDNGWAFSKRFQFCDLKPNELGFQTCASGFSGGAIYVDGTFNYCHVHFGDDRIKAQTIFDEEKTLLEMIENSGDYQNDRSEDCKKCRYRSVCTSGCPVYRMERKDPQCSLYHKFIPKYFELQAFERIYHLYDTNFIKNII